MQSGKLTAAINSAPNDEQHTAGANNSLLYVNCKIDHQLNRFLVDTGSALTIISRKLAKNVEPSSLRLTAANGSTIRNYGTTVLNLTLHKLRREYPWRCIVADVTTPIIGADFLAHYGILVDCKNSRIIDSTTKISSQGQVCHDKYEIFPIQAVSADAPDYVVQLLKEFSSIAQPFSGREQVTHKTQHYIETTGPPVASKCRPLYGEKLQAAKAEFEKLSELGVVQSSKSPWSSPIHFVPKGDAWRIVGDYRRLNTATK